MSKEQYIYKNGRVAYHNGKFIYENPYQGPSEVVWKSGWLDAQREWKAMINAPITAEPLREMAEQVAELVPDDRIARNRAKWAKASPAATAKSLRKFKKRLRVVEQRMENRALIEAALKNTLAEVDRLRSMEGRLVNLEREMGEANTGELVSALNSLSMRLAKIEQIIMERTGEL